MTLPSHSLFFLLRRHLQEALATSLAETRTEDRMQVFILNYLYLTWLCRLFDNSYFTWGFFKGGLEGKRVSQACMTTANDRTIGGVQRGEWRKERIIFSAKKEADTRRWWHVICGRERNTRQGVRRKTALCLVPPQCDLAEFHFVIRSLPKRETKAREDGLTFGLCGFLGFSALFSPCFDLKNIFYCRDYWLVISTESEDENEKGQWPCQLFFCSCAILNAK
jgi:hypothetical protein